MIALALVPALLGGLEIGLRFSGYGYSTDFFRKIEIGGEPAFVENDRFGWRFFPPALARSPAPVVMSAAKGTNTYRIFLFGESAALGDPDPAYGAGRYLEALLNERFPGRRFEVVCVAMTAINSHGILPIARECATHEGNLWIIYMGNNEMAGPFGAATVFGPKTPPLAFVRLSLGLQRTRVGQLLAAWSLKLHGKSGDRSEWEGMKMFTETRVVPDDPHKETVYRNFQRNLDDILRAGAGSGAKVVLSTVGVNLKDCPPFASLSSTNLPNPAAREEYKKLCGDGLLAETQGAFDLAAEYYTSAAKLSPQSAELQFRLGGCLLGLTNNAAARPHFELARDLDEIPLRTDSRLNQIITQAGGSRAGRDLALCDAANMLATNSPAGVPGEESFYEHVHLNFDGNYLLARAWAEQVGQFLPADLTNQAATDWASQETCERVLGLTDWNRYDVLQKALGRVLEAPFTNQINNAARISQMTRQLAEIKGRLHPRAIMDARFTCEEAVKQRPNDHWLHQKFAEFLEDVGDLPQAVKEWEKVRDLLPHHHLAYFQAGRLLAAQGKWADAQPLLVQAVTLRPDLSEGWFELGKMHAAQGNFSLALDEYDRARALVPENFHIYYQMGKALSKAGRSYGAIDSFRKAIQLGPKNYWEAHNALGEELAFAGKDAEARAEFETVINLKPNFAMAHLNLGVAMVKQGQLETAAEQFAETLRLDPGNKLAQDALAKIVVRQLPTQ